MQTLINALTSAPQTFSNVFLAVLRYLMPVLAALLLWRCAKPLLSFRREPEIWAWLCLPDGNKLPITHWENVIGRSKRSDIVVDFPTISRNHAVLTRYDDGSWTITDTDSKDGVQVNGQNVRICAIGEEDTITIGGLDMRLQPISRRQEIHLAQLRTKASSGGASVANLLLLTVMQVLFCLAFLLCGDPETGGSILLGFGGIMTCQWLLLLFYLSIRRLSFEVETIAFFLCTIGMAVIATVTPDEAVKQLLAMVLGLVLFLAVGWSLRDLERAKKIRYLATAAGIGLLIFTLIFGTEQNGAKNWVSIGSMSLQPSELSKVCFVFAGASTMDRIMNKRNLILFIAYSAVICGCLALMNDFGTALIFFCAFLVIAWLRSGSLGTIALAIAALAFAGVLVIRIAPHALGRFASWRHIWEDPWDSGYQQTRALMCLASGGLFGVGARKGYLRYAVYGFAADSDIVFATVSEEWGLLLAIMMVACIVVLGLFAVRSASVARSGFYIIGGCTAAGILLMQAILNCLGTLDVLPLTGVTFPFASNGGSSMIAAWGLLAFVKAADTRQNASFAVRLPKNRGKQDE